MTISSTTITGAELTAFQADKPLLLSESAQDTSDTPRWTTSGSHADASQVATNYPTARIRDGHMHLDTRPNATNTGWYLSMKTSAVAEIDALIIRGHNFASAPSSVTVVWEGSLYSNFSSPQTLASFLASAAVTPVVRLLADRYTGIEYVRVRFVCGSAWTPRIGELFVGRRRQLTVKPDRPFNPERIGWSGASHVATGGHRTRYVRHSGGLHLLPTFALTAAGIATLKAWWSGSSYGGSKSWWIYDPTTAPQKAALVEVEQTALELEEETFDLYRCPLELVEVPPYLSEVAP